MNMKMQMKRVLMTMSLVMCVCTLVYAGTDKTILFNQLPQKAQQLVHQHFKGKKTAIVKQDTEWLSKSYDVIFTDGSKVEFDKNGDWTEVDCKPHVVPVVFLPSAINSFVKKNYPGVSVVKIEKVRNGYDVELSNHMEITFDKKFQVVDVDR